MKAVDRNELELEAANFAKDQSADDEALFTDVREVAEKHLRRWRASDSVGALDETFFAACMEAACLEVARAGATEEWRLLVADRDMWMREAEETQAKLSNVRAIVEDWRERSDAACAIADGPMVEIEKVLK